MATFAEFTQAVSSLGFFPVLNFQCGTWRGYAVSIWRSSGKRWFATAAVRIPNLSGVRKTLKNAVKELGAKPGVVQQCTDTRAMFGFTLGGTEDTRQSIQSSLDLMAATLHKVGIAPADSCAVSGLPAPDSLCLVRTKDGAYSYQPVMASVIRSENAEVQKRTEENEADGSMVSGFVGAVLGMLVGVVLNLLTIIFLERVLALVFALVPLAAMFGYKLFKGKMNKGAIVIVLLLCLFAVLLMPYLELVYYVVHDYGTSLGEALPACVQLYVENFSELTGELAQLLLFMGLGVFIAWRSMFGQINSAQVRASQLQLDSLRPNPNRPQQNPQP